MTVYELLEKILTLCKDPNCKILDAKIVIETKPGWCLTITESGASNGEQ